MEISRDELLALTGRTVRRDPEAARRQLVVLAGRGQHGTAFLWGRARPRPALRRRYWRQAPLRVFRDPFTGSARDARLVWNWLCRLECWAECVSGWGLKSVGLAQEVALEHLAAWHEPDDWVSCSGRDCRRPHAQWGNDPAGLVEYPVVSRGHVLSWASLTPKQVTERVDHASSGR
jgi:hypothetical protein